MPDARHRTASRRIAVLSAVLLGLLAAPATAQAEPSWSPPPPPTGALADLGAPLKSLTISEGVIGPDHEGRTMAYAVPLGENARLNVVDVATRTLVRTVTLPGASGGHTVAVAPDATVYVGSFYNGRLYRYHPATGTVDDLGQPLPGESYVYGLSIAPDGTVYGGTFPNARVFAYRPDGEIKDFGSMDPTLQYVRNTAYDPERQVLYAGLSTKALIKRIDVRTGAVRDVTPAGLTGTTVLDLDYAGDRIFANVDGKLVVLDAETNERVDVVDAASGQPTSTYPVAARGVSPERQGGVYFTTTGYYVARYDLATDTVSTRMPDGRTLRATRGATIGYGWAVENGNDVLYALAGNYSGGGLRYDIDSGTNGSLQFPFEYVPSPLQHVSTRADDAKVYVNAFLNGQLGVYDPATGATTQPVRTGQVEGWTWSDGKLYAGTYPNGTLTVWDPAKPAASGSNPLNVFSLKTSHQQIRPVAVVAAGDRILLGTSPDYGLYGGALTVYDKVTGEYQVHRDVVPRHTVAALAVTGSTVWGGTSTEGGTGTDPLPGEAKLFSFDAATGTKTGELTPVPGASTINELTVDRDGRLWGLADGTLFQFDPATRTVLRTTTIHTQGVAAGEGELAWHPNGYLYGVSRQRLFVADPLAGTATVVPTTGAHRITVSGNGTVYLLLRPEGQTNFTNLASYVPAPGACAAPDVRARAYVDGVDSGVANRFVRDGCTLTDLAPRRGDLSAEAFVEAVSAWANGLKDAGVVTNAEAKALRQAAHVATRG